MPPVERTVRAGLELAHIYKLSLTLQQRRDALAAAAGAMFSQDFAGRCLPFDATAADCYAAVVSGRRSAGYATTT